ncbi:MFS general substrate transporter [Pseudovirgaria hyperparasitica]|uniref:MFS general substrate transporter n=1 Tax=Pseudovirgaria hyperparasitica TaxID=470096 RepID=A0A6A6WI88_9PEZI|nr:MFS general substrate transporter [Pseudovirgaria hyperparasitica]KAF2762523.1 MFS general substrate transporter [Pseudovirgaria hyperparasitica]
MSETTPLIERAKKVDRKAPMFLAFRSSKWFIIFTVTAAVFTDTLLYAVVVPVFPFALHERAGIDTEDIQWWESFLFALFGIAGLVLSPICGYIADRSSNRQVPFVFGLIMAILGTILFGLAEDVWLLVASRIRQAIASAIVWSVGLAVVIDSVPKGEVGQSTGIVLSGVSVGYILSPTLGGIVYEHSGYMSVFGMCAGLLTVDILLRILMIEKKTAAQYIPKDEEGNEGDVIFTKAIGCEPSVQPTDGRQNGVSSPAMLPKNPPKKHQLPLVIQFFITPRFFVAFWGFCVYVAVLGAYDCVLALYVKRRFGWSPMFAGLIYLTLAVPSLTAPLVGSWAEKSKPRWFAIIGCCLAAVMQALLMLVDQEGTSKVYLLIVLLVGLGCVHTLIGAPLASEMSACVDQLERDNPAAFEGYSGGGYAQSSSLLNVANSIGLLMGTTFAGYLMDNYGWRLMSIGLASLTFSGAIPAAVLELKRVKRQGV